MRADRDDAPSYLRQSGFKQSARTWAIPVLFGTCIALGLLQAGSSLLLKNMVQRLADSPGPKTTPVAEINYSVPVSDQDKWDRIVQEQVRRDNPQALIQPPIDFVPTTTPKQTVFHDQNYTPRGADNVVSFRTAPEPYVPYIPSQQGVRVTIVGETRSMKEKACWPWREGSIEKRNCKFETGLHYRDKN